MAKGLIHSDLIEVRTSPIHGHGVFAKTFIKAGQILEENRVIPVSDSSLLSNFMFQFPRSEEYKKFKVTNSELVMTTGYGSLYNSSESKEGANTMWSSDLPRRVVIMQTIKSVNKDEELLIYYGDLWWEERPDITVKKRNKIPKFKQ